MYVIVVYDVEADRTREPRKYLRQHLNHVQNSVFEGQVTESNAENIESKIEEFVQDSSESIIMYKLWSDEYMDRTVYGDDPAEDSQFL